MHEYGKDSYTYRFSIFNVTVFSKKKNSLPVCVDIYKYTCMKMKIEFTNLIWQRKQKEIITVLKSFSKIGNQYLPTE